MKRSFFAAGIGICIFAVTMVVSNHPVQAEVYNGTYIQQDTTPKKKDTTKKKPDTMNLNQQSTSNTQN